MTDGNLKPAVAYCRVSTEKQRRDGISLAVQQKRIAAFASAAGYQIVETYQEAGTARGSSALAERPQLQACLERARTSGMPVIVTTMDRLVRHAPSLDEINRLGVEVIDISSPQYTGLQSQISAEMAQIEGDEIAERRRIGISRARAEGRAKFGNPKLHCARKVGTHSGKRRAAERYEMRATILFNLEQRGAVTDQSFADALNAAGLPNTHRGMYTRQSAGNLRRRINERRGVSKLNYGLRDVTNEDPEFEMMREALRKMVAHYNIGLEELMARLGYHRNSEGRYVDAISGHSAKSEQPFDRIKAFTYHEEKEELFLASPKGPMSGLN